MSKDAYWFRHDANARNDPKMCKLLMVGGQAAKGCFWDLIEILRETENYELKMDEIPAIEFQCRFIENAVQQMIDCELLRTNGVVIWSQSLKDRMEHLDAIKEKRRQAGKLGGEAKAKATSNKVVPIDNQLPSKSEANAKQTSLIYSSQIQSDPINSNRSDVEHDLQVDKTSKSKEGEMWSGSPSGQLGDLSKKICELWPDFEPAHALDVVTMAAHNIKAGNPKGVKWERMLEKAREKWAPSDLIYLNNRNKLHPYLIAWFGNAAKIHEANKVREGDSDDQDWHDALEKMRCMMEERGMKRIYGKRTSEAIAIWRKDSMYPVADIDWAEGLLRKFEEKHGPH